MFNSVIQGSVTPANFFVCIGVALALGLIVALTHMKTSRSSANFATTLAILPMLVAMAIMLVNGNLGAGVATMGIFSLVRFRSIAGNSKSLLSVFFVMAIGLACGTGYIAFGAIFTIITAFAIGFLSFIKFGSSGAGEKKLIVMIPEDMDYTEIFDDIFKNFTKSHFLERVKTTNMGSLFELAYRLEFKNGASEKDFIDKIRVRNGNLKVALSHNISEEEL